MINFLRKLSVAISEHDNDIELELEEAFFETLSWVVALMFVADASIQLSAI